MRLRDLRINQVPFYFQNYDGVIDEVDEDGNFTGDTVEVCGSVTKANARISPSAGQEEKSPFGANLRYDRQISTVERLPIDEQTRLFIDVVPVINGDGSTDTAPDYECIAVANDLQQNVWAIRKINNAN